MPGTNNSNGVNGSNASNSLSANDNIRRFAAPSRPLSPLPEHALFHNKTRCFVYGLQPRAVQGMLDFDFICKRSTPSVAGIIYTFGGQFVSKMYWGTSETLLPVYQEVPKAMAKHPEVDVVVNFASSRSVFSSTMELMEYPQIKTIAIIAEGVPERVRRGPIQDSNTKLVANKLFSELEKLLMLQRRRALPSSDLLRLVASSLDASKSATRVA
jgi:ATP citrate (pro-S)-lyase